MKKRCGSASDGSWQSWRIEQRLFLCPDDRWPVLGQSASLHREQDQRCELADYLDFVAAAAYQDTMAANFGIPPKARFDKLTSEILKKVCSVFALAGIYHRHDE